VSMAVVSSGSLRVGVKILKAETASGIRHVREAT
jgi:hypothetical protein